MFAALKSFQPTALAAAIATTSAAASKATAVAGKITQVVKEAGVLLDQEQEEFVKEKKRKGEPLETALETAVPPWVGFEKEAELRRDILALSLDNRNFIIDPPPDVDFHFDMKESYNIAMVTLQEDPNLEKMRFELVPKTIKEPIFWRNYFYRCSLARQALQLERMEPGSRKRSEDGKNSEKVNAVEATALDAKAQLEDLKVNDGALKAATVPDRAVAPSNETDGNTDLVDDPDGWMEDELAKMQLEGTNENGVDEAEEGTDGEKGGDGGEVIADWERELQLELSDFNG